MAPEKNHFSKIAGVIITCAAITACTDIDVTNPPGLNSGEASAGSAGFGTYVAIGDSLTAGFADGALYLLGQQNSFPNILSQQFSAIGGGTFTQPLTSDNLGGLLFGGVADPVNFPNRLALNTSTQAPESVDGTPTTEVIGSGLNGMTFNNMGVPGAKTFHLLAGGYGDIAGLGGGTANPYYVRFSSNNASGGALALMTDVATQVPTFVTLWIGNNDVLGFATSGGVPTTPGGIGVGSDDITPTATFDTSYDAIVGAITGANANVQGVIANIPDVASIPFFTTVPYNAIPLEQADVDTLNAAYAAYNAGLQMAVAGMAITQEEADRRTINFVVGQNAVIIEDTDDLTDLSGLTLPSYRHATASDLILLPASSYLGTENMSQSGTTPPAGMPWGLGTGLEDADVLVASEIQAIDDARTAFNSKIKAVADANANFAFFDAAALMDELSTNGISFGTGSITATYATGGGFSLDGVHPTARGYAVVANAFIDEINATFNANVHKVDPATYPATLLK